MKKKSSVEFREFQVAELRTSSEDGKPRITGHAAVFNLRSEPIWPGFREIIAPGAFKKTLQEADVHAFFNHDPKFVLGRNKSGTLKLWEDERGLAFELAPPDTQMVRDLVIAPMERGDVDQMSFGFIPIRKRSDWREEGGEPVVTRHEVKLMEISLAAKGAYPQTDAALMRSALEPEEEDGFEFVAVARAMAKLDAGLVLTEDERALITNAIEALQRSIATAPDLAAHPVEEKEPCQFDAETLWNLSESALASVAHPN